MRFEHRFQMYSLRLFFRSSSFFFVSYLLSNSVVSVQLQMSAAIFLDARPAKMQDLVRFVGSNEECLHIPRDISINTCNPTRY